MSGDTVRRPNLRATSEPDVLDSIDAAEDRERFQKLLHNLMEHGISPAASATSHLAMQIFTKM